MVRAASKWRGVVELLIVAGVFALAGIGCGLFMVLTAPFSESFLWWASRTMSAAAAAAIVGAAAWWALCSHSRQYAVWRWILVGFLGGVFCHPIYYVLSPRFDGTWVRIDELPMEWLFSFLICGGCVITVPAGLVAAGICRAFVQIRHHS